MQYNELKKLTLKQLDEEENKEFAEWNYPDLIILSSTISSCILDATIFEKISKEEAFDKISEAYNEWIKSMSENRKIVTEKYDALRRDLI